MTGIDRAGRAVHLFRLARGQLTFVATHRARGRVHDLLPLRGSRLALAEPQASTAPAAISIWPGPPTYATGSDHPACPDRQRGKCARYFLRLCGVVCIRFIHSWALPAMGIAGLCLIVKADGAVTTAN